MTPVVARSPTFMEGLLFVWLLGCLRGWRVEQGQDGSIVDGGEVVEPFADGAEVGRFEDADDGVGFAGEAVGGGGGGDADGGDDFGGAEFAHGGDGGGHGGAGGDAVVDEEDGTAGDVEGAAAAAVEAFATAEFGAFEGDFAFDFELGDAQLPEEIVIEDDDFADGEGAHGEFRLPGDAEFADEADVEREVQRAGDGGAEDDAAAGEGEDEAAGGAAVGAQFVGEPVTGVGAIGEGVHESWLLALEGPEVGDDVVDAELGERGGFAGGAEGIAPDGHVFRAVGGGAGVAVEDLGDVT